MLNVSSKELRSIAKNINISGYESMPKDELLGTWNYNTNRNNM